MLMHNPLRVLVAGGTPLAAHAAGLLQGAPGVRVRVAAGADEAAALLAAGGWDAAVADGGSPAGLALARRARDEGWPTPLVLVAARADDALEHAARDAGAVDLVGRDELTAPLLLRAVRYAAHAARAEPAAGAEARLSREEEQALRTGEAQFRAVFEEAPIGMALVDMDGRLVRTNRALQDMLGYPEAELANAFFSRITHPDDLAADWELFGDLVAADITRYQILKRYLRRDGTDLWGMLSMSLVRSPGGAPRYAIGMVENVTKRRSAEEALRRSEQQLLQVQKMEAVGRLAGGVAHDFNNLLTAIRGNAELLLSDLPPESASREDVEEIRRAADRAAALTRQLLAFSRRQMLQPRMLDLNRSVAEMERMLRRLVGAEVELETRLDPALRTVRADPAQVEQVILNLAVNARDAMPDGGVLMVCTGNAELGEELRRRYDYVVPGEYVLLEVGDTGHGMDPATREMAFEPFFTTKPGDRGTGLGLSMVYGIVKQSGGYVWIDSEPGRGTRVRVYLPVARGEPEEEEEEPVPVPLPRARGRGTVLLVEDEETVRRLTGRVLARGGYDVLAAAEGAEAMALSRQHPGVIQVLVTDLVMPRMNGSDLARRLMAERPGIRVLFMSGYDRDAARTSGPLEPGTDFIEKPFSPEVLLERVSRLLEQSIYPASPGTG